MTSLFKSYINDELLYCRNFVYDYLGLFAIGKQTSTFVGFLISLYYNYTRSWSFLKKQMA